MERVCKNCNHLLYVGHSHCAACGAKWIEKRITMRNVAADFGDLYLGLDTKFAHTFLDLFKRPEAVINGYIHGRRAYYMDAIRYTLLALLVSGIYTYLMRNSDAFELYLEEILSSMPTSADLEGAAASTAGLQRRMMNIMFDFQGLVYFITIPFLAIAARITFWGRRFYNFTEHVVFFLYTYAHIFLVTTPISILLMYVSFDVYSYWSLITFPAMFLYNAWCYKRCFKLDISTTILKSLVAIVVLIGIFLIFMILIVLLAITGGSIAKHMGWI
jgi:hypothetical protein